MSQTSNGELWPDNPHNVPHIECKRCGHENHIDAALVDERRCVECNGFIRRPTEDEEREFGRFIAWNSAQMEKDG